MSRIVSLTHGVADLCVAVPSAPFLACAAMLGQQCSKASAALRSACNKRCPLAAKPPSISNRRLAAAAKLRQLPLQCVSTHGLDALRSPMR